MLRTAFGARAGIRRTLLFLCLLAALASTPKLVAFAGPPSQSPEEGKALFEGKCAACHTVGQGVLVGPDLKDVTTRRDDDWLTRWLLDPDKMLDENDPIATELLAQYTIRMPNQGLSAADVASLIAFFGPQGGTAPVTAPPAELPQGDDARGKKLFLGTESFQSDLPGCIACHSVAGIGALGGGTLGPDLTGSFAKYGRDQGMAAILANIPFPTMRSVFGDDLVLTPQEQADVRAFLREASIAQRPAETVWQLALIALGGTALLLVVAHLLWRRRLKKVRKPMLAS